MERPADPVSMVEMFMHPVFCVRDGVITEANQAALQRQIRIGTPVSELISAGKDEYASYKGGYLSLSLYVCDCTYIVTISRYEGYDVFHILSEYEDPNLRTMALVAQQLREPLASAMTVADRLFPNQALKDDPAAQEKIAQINRSLYKLLRTINNMSDAGICQALTSNNMQVLDIVSVFEEVLSRCAELSEQADRKLKFVRLNQIVYCPVDRQMLERAILNLFSNAVKYSPKGSTIRAGLTRNGSKLSFTMENDSAMLRDEQLGNLFFRYLREPGIEDGRHGLGLGLRMVQGAAAVHGGTLLVDRPTETGIRFTMTAAIRQSKENTVRTPGTKILPGGYDEALIELSDILPSDLYKNIN